MGSVSRCYDPKQLYKPQWAYPTPADARDEIFLLPFSFTMPGDGMLHQYFPIQLDDDVPWTLHGIFFPEINPTQAGLGGIFPGLCRITDAHGNPLSQGLVLSLGAWGIPGAALGAAFGFPIEPAIECPPGGTLQLDFAISTNAGIALALDAGVAALLEVFANIYGTGGNGYSIQVINGAALSVAVVGTAVTVTINTGVSTFQDVAGIINNTPAAAAVLIALVFGANPAEIIVAFGPTALAGGSASSPITVEGTVLGSKRFRECL